MRPMPPDKILNEEFLKPLGLTENGLAKATGLPANRITGRNGDLEAFFKTSAGFLDEPANDRRP
jgi:hypothetical protein